MDTNHHTCCHFLFYLFHLLSFFLDRQCHMRFFFLKVYLYKNDFHKSIDNIC